VEVLVPAGLAVKLVGTTGMGSILVDPRLVQTGEGTYESANYDANENRITIDVSNGAGNVSVQMQQ
jgi:predicted membrane protein